MLYISDEMGNRCEQVLVSTYRRGHGEVSVPAQYERMQYSAFRPERAPFFFFFFFFVRRLQGLGIRCLASTCGRI